MHQEKIIIWWDTTSSPACWQAAVLKLDPNGVYDHVGDSRNGGFPVSLENFGPFEEDLLIKSIKEAFPGADVNLKF